MVRNTERGRGTCLISVGEGLMVRNTERERDACLISVGEEKNWRCRTCLRWEELASEEKRLQQVTPDCVIERKQWYLG